MKAIINKKGFTMVELLAVIAILGILSTIGLTAISKILDKSRANYYKTTENTLLEAGQSYVLNNRSLLPKEIGEVKTFTLDELYEAKAVTEKLTDENSKTCDGQKSKFYIYKKSSSEYSYDAILYCPSCDDKKNCKELTASEAPTIEIHTTGCTGNNLEGISSTNAKVKITAPSNSKISSYSYNIYKGNKNIYYSGPIMVKDLSVVNVTINLSKYLPGTIKIVVKSTTKDGGTYSEESSLTCKDTENVTCKSTLNYEDNNLYKKLTAQAGDTVCNDEEWLNATNTKGRKVWVDCVAGTGTNCKEPTYSGTYSKDSTYKTINMEDSAGNHGTCTVKTCIDKTYPKITVQIYKANSNGKATGNVINEFSVDAGKDKTKNVVTNQVTGWINKSTAPNGVVIRISASDATSKIKTLVYKEKASGKNETDEKRLQFGNEKSLKKDTNDILLKTDGYKQYEVIATDHAGNSSKLDFDVMYDKTAPAKPTVSMFVHSNSDGVSSSNNLSSYTNDTWTKLYVFTQPSGSTDAISGFKEYQYTTTGKTTNESNKAGRYRNILAKGTSKIKYRACDNAGNCSAYTSNYIIKEDRTAPTCGTANGASSTWTGNNRTVKLACSDSQSGCANTTYEKTFSSNTKTYTQTISDKVGNTRNCKYNVYVDKCTAKSDWKKSGSCSCSGSTGSQKKIKKSTFGSGFTCDTTYVDCSNKCAVTIYACRGGNTCIHDSNYSCGYIISNNSSYQDALKAKKSSNGKKYYIVSGTVYGSHHSGSYDGTGKWIYAKCATTDPNDNCSSKTCPG